MEYIGEHVLPGQFGRFFVSLAFASAIISAISYYLFHKNGELSYKRLARTLFITHALSVFAIVGTLFYMMISHYFEYDYIWKHSSLDLPGRYIFSAFWEGQEGSFILWMFWHAVLGLILMFTAKKWEASSMLIFALVQAFLATMILGIYIGDTNIGSSPFVLMRNARENIGLPWTSIPDYLEKFPVFMDGRGLNPLLQNYWMTIHPPTLFLGFASVLPPFALAMAGLLTRDYGGWVKQAIPWSYFSIMIFGTGILMGGAWAYEALSFGGFWAWDPVENSSLVPWLTMVGAAHLLLVYRNRKSGLVAAFFMVIVSFILVLYSTFLTRSGVLGDSSVHAFVDLGLNGQLLIYLFFFVIISFGMFIYHYRKIPKNAKEDELSSREFWMFIGSLVLLISAFQIIFSTSIPVLNKLIGPDGLLPILDKDKAPPIDAIKSYNSFQIPFAIAITILIGIAQFLNYRKTSSDLFWKRIQRSGIISIGLTLVFSYIYNFWKEPLNLGLLFTGIFAAVSNIDYWIVIHKGRFTVSGSSVAHFGFALIMVGALISNAKQKIISNTDVFLSEDLPSSENALLELNDSTKLGDYMTVWTGMREEPDKQFYDVEYFKKNKSGNWQKNFELHPFLQMSDNMGPTPNPSTRHYWNKDIYTHITYSSYLENRSPDGYVNETEISMGKGDTAIYEQHFIILDSIATDTSFNQSTQQLDLLRLTAFFRVKNILGEVYDTKAVYQIEDGILSYEDGIMELQRFKFRLADIDFEAFEKENARRFKVKAWVKVEDQEPFIIMKAIVFPLINLLWLGCILMAVGTGIAVWQRIKPKRA